MRNWILLLSLILMTGSAFAQFHGGPRPGPDRDGRWRPGPGPRPPERSTVCFFEDVNYGGASLCVGAGDRLPNLVQMGWNDRISSIALYGRASVVVYQDVNYGGQALSINQNTPDIRVYGAYWNDFISSAVIGGGAMPPPPPPPRLGRVCFFRDINYGGASFCLQPGQSQANLVPSGWNDQISSVSVEGDASVVLYQDINYGGRNILVNASTPDIRVYGNEWNDLTSSLNVLRAYGRN